MPRFVTKEKVEREAPLTGFESIDCLSVEKRGVEAEDWPRLTANEAKTHDLKHRSFLSARLNWNIRRSCLCFKSKSIQSLFFPLFCPGKPVDHMFAFVYQLLQFSAQILRRPLRHGLSPRTSRRLC